MNYYALLTVLQYICRERVDQEAETCGTDDHDRPNSVPEQEFLNHQAGFDGLAETYIIGDEEIDSRHSQRSNNRVELVVLDRDAGPKGSLQDLRVSRGDSAPTNCVEECVKAQWIVEALGGRSGQCGCLENFCCRLNFPYDGQIVSKAIVLNGSQLDQCLTFISQRNRSGRGLSRTLDIHDSPMAISNKRYLADSGALLTEPPHRIHILMNRNHSEQEDGQGRGIPESSEIASRYASANDNRPGRSNGGDPNRGR